MDTFKCSQCNKTQCELAGTVQHVVFSIDVVFLIDMLLAARVAHYTTSGERLVTSGWKVLKRYLTGRLWFDLAMNFPFIEVVNLLTDSSQTMDGEC